MTKNNPNAFSPFKQGELIWLEARNLRLPYESRKLQPKRLGPFKITKVLGKTVYKLQLPFQWKIHDVFHASLLTPYSETEEHGENFIKPPPDLIDGQEEFEIESIIGHRKKGRQWEFLIKWKGYASSDQTWEPESNLTNADETLLAYKKERKLETNPSQSTPNSLSSPSSKKPYRRTNRFSK